jgi:hypothetical protein
MGLDSLVRTLWIYAHLTSLAFTADLHADKQPAQQEAQCPGSAHHLLLCDLASSGSFAFSPSL